MREKYRIGIKSVYVLSTSVNLKKVLVRAQSYETTCSTQLNMKFILLINVQLMCICVFYQEKSLF